jgi:flagellar assembly protein FliH
MIIKKKIIQRQGDSVENSSETEVTEENSVAEEAKEEEIDIFNLDNIDFKQRNERRRGDRRRGFRRIDDRNLISRAREEAQSIKESSQKEGYQEGLNQAKADIEEMRDTLTAFMGAKQEVFDTVAPYVMEMSLDIAKKIIKREIETDPSIILDNIQQLLKTLSKEESKITLKVNPIQVSLVKSEVPEMLTNVGLEARIMVVPDDSIMEGGCLVETTNGVIDATIETQLSVISEALKEV